MNLNCIIMILVISCARISQGHIDTFNLNYLFSKKIFDQHQWVVSNLIPKEQKDISFFALNTWFKTKQINFKSGEDTLISIQTDQQLRLVEVIANYQQSNMRLYIQQNTGFFPLKIDYTFNRWYQLILIVHKEQQIVIISTQNDQLFFTNIQLQYNLLQMLQQSIIISAKSFASDSSFTQFTKIQDLLFHFGYNKFSLDQILEKIINISAMTKNCKQIALNNKQIPSQVTKQCYKIEQVNNLQFYDSIFENSQSLLICFNLVYFDRFSYEQKSIFKFLNKFIVVAKQVNKNIYLLIHTANQTFHIGVVENVFDLISIQIEFERLQKQIFTVKYYSNYILKGQIQLETNIYFMEKLYEQEQKKEQKQEIMLKNVFIFQNFKLIEQKIKYEQTSNCLLQARSISNDGLYLTFCIFNYLSLINQVTNKYPITKKIQNKRNLQTINLIHGDNLKNIVRYINENKQVEATIDLVQNFQSLLVIGYFYLNENIQDIQPLITIGVKSEFYNLFNLLLLDDQNIQLKYIDDVKNVISTINSTFSSIQNTWIGLGIIYSKTLSQVKFVFSNTNSQLASSQVLNGVLIPSRISTLDVCISCIIEGGNFGNFKGKFSTVKTIYNVEYNSIDSFYLFNEVSQINKQIILNEQFDFNKYVSSSEYNIGQEQYCKTGFAFNEGVCIQQNKCESLFKNTDIYEAFEVGKYYEELEKKCKLCSNNCLNCITKSQCSSCRPGYFLYSGQCFECNYGADCNLICPGQKVFDQMNQICIDKFDINSHTLFNPLLSSRIIINNNNYEINIMPSKSLQIIYCYIDSQNNPFTLHSFLGGIQFTPQTVLFKSWAKIPNGYLKSVSFYVIFNGNGNPSNLQIRINSMLADITSSELVSDKTECSGSANQLYKVFKVKFIKQDYSKIFNLEIKSQVQNWGVRNIRIEIFKCHPTCNSCLEGGSITDCTTCGKGFNKNKFQCICQQGQYAKYLNCFESQCSICENCQIPNCLKCEDITGKCTNCKQGYIILNGLCVKELYCSSDLDLKFQNYCGQKFDIGFDQFQNNRIVQYADYWKFSQDQIFAVTCKSYKCLPILSQNQTHSLTMNLPNFKNYHIKITFTLGVFVYQSIDFGPDKLSFYDEDVEIDSRNYAKYKGELPGRDFYYSLVHDDTFQYTKTNNKLLFKVISRSDEKNNIEGYSFTNLKFFYNRCHPFCKTCTDINIQSCTTCIDNSVFVNGICQCIDGFYFLLVRVPEGNELPGKCNLCNPSCKTCIGPSYQDCISCYDGYTNIGKICQYNCQDDQYWDQISQTCINCHTCCKTCISNQNNSCHDCHKGFTFNVLDKSCMIYNAQCQPCTVALNSLCGGSQHSHDECIKNNWIILNTEICVNCGLFQNDECGGNQSYQVIQICNKNGFYNYDGQNCSSCKNIISNRCGISELQDTCQNNGWIKKDQNRCVQCGKFINGSCGGDNTEENIQFCAQKGFVNYDNINCFSCISVISQICGGIQMKDRCITEGWKIYDSINCYNCSIFENGECGILSTQDTINNCKINGFMVYDKLRCSSCKDVISGSCGRSEIKEKCFNHGWDQYDQQKCIDCNVSSSTFSQCICHSTCLQCSRYFNPEYCTSCKPSLFFFKGQCLEKCPNGYTINGQNCIPCTDQQMPTCYNCYQTCQICSPFQVSQIKNTCIKCSSNTRFLLNGECKCKDPEDSREIFHECSFETFGVLNAVLSNKSPILSIDFGKYLNIPDNFISEQFSEKLCQYLFISSTLDLFGSSCQCMISSKSIIVQLGNDSSIFEGDFIYLNQNILSFMTSPSTIITTYMNNIVSQEQLIGNTIVKFNSESIFNYCDDINITFNQIINDSKRGFKSFSWSLVSFSSQDPGFQTILTNKIKQLNSENGLNLIIQKGIIKPDEQVLIQFDYILKVNIKSSLQLPISVIVQKKITIEVQNSFQYSYYRHQNRLIVVSTITKICKLDGDQIFNDPIKLQIASIQIPSLKSMLSSQSNFYHNLEFQPYSLQVGLNILKIQANHVSDQKIQSQMNYKLQVDQSQLYIKILGGDGYFNYKNNIVLKSLVRDFDLPKQNEPQEINISWQCVEQLSKMPCLSRKQNLITFQQNQEIITIEGFTFDPYTAIKISLTGEKQINRKNVDTISILLSELDLPQLKVTIQMQDPKQETVNQNEELYIEMDYSKTINQDLLSYSGVIQYKNAVVATIKFDYSKFRIIIQNYFSDFDRDQSKLQLRLSVYNPQYAMPSISTVQLTLNFPPNNCKFKVSPEDNIFQYETKLLLVLDECQDDDQPLQYQFFYYQNAEDFESEKKYPNQVKRKQISDKTSNYIQEASFPSGQIVILVQAIDSKNSIYNTTKVINVQKKQYDEQSYLSLIGQKIDKSLYLPYGKAISELNTICDDILQRPEFSSSQLINQQKIIILIQLNNLKQNMSSLSTFSTAADKGIVSLIKSGITQTQSEQKQFLNKIIHSLDNNSNLYEMILEQSKEKLKQNIYDTFQIIDKQQAQSQNFDQISELFTKIGLYQFKIILPNENPIYFEGENMSIFQQLITPKYSCYYFICNFNDEQKNQTNLYNYTLANYYSNPYQNDSSFLNYTNQFYNQTSNKTSSSIFPLVTPIIVNNAVNNTKALPNQIIIRFQNTSQISQYNKTACISKDDLSNSWTKSNCKGKFNDKLNKYECFCSKLFPTTIIDDIEDLMSRSNIETVLSSEGVSNIASFSNFYNYTIFWLIVIQNVGFFSFFSIGNLIDKSDQKQKKQQNYQKVIPFTNFSQILPTKINQIVPLNELLDKNENQISDQKSSTSKKTITSAINNENNYLNDNQDQMLDSYILQQKVSSRNIHSEFQTPRSSRQSSTFFKKFKLSKYGSAYQDQMTNTGTNNTIITEQIQKELPKLLNNQTPPIQKKEPPQKPEEKQTNISVFLLNQPKYKQILIFHNFFGIFYLYDAYLSRQKRFLVFYIRSLHSLAISVIFDQTYSVVQNIAVAIINAIIIIIINKILIKILSFRSLKGIVSSRIIIAIITAGYYYIILAIISGQSPDESNKFIITFLMIYIGDIFVVAFISAIIQRLVAPSILKKLNTKLIAQYLFQLFELQIILINFDSQ